MGKFYFQTANLLNPTSNFTCILFSKASRKLSMASWDMPIVPLDSDDCEKKNGTNHIFNVSKINKNRLQESNLNKNTLQSQGS